MILIEASTGTLLLNDKDLNQEIVHTLLLEEYVVVIIMDRRQDSNAASIQAETFGPAAQGRYYVGSSGRCAKKRQVW